MPPTSPSTCSRQAAGDGLTIGPMLLGARTPVHILTPTATVRRIVNVTALLSVEEILPPGSPNPFPILCGTSAGAINAASLAVFAEDFDAAVANLLQVWENFSAHQVYRADPTGIGVAGARWLATLAVGWITRRAPRSLLDNSPLRQLLEERPRLRPHRARDRKRRPAFVEHHLFRLFLGAERVLLPGARRPRRLAPQPARRRAGTRSRWIT
jgi:hypothetical protein